MSRLSSIRRLLFYLRFISRLIRRVASWDGFWWVAGITAVLVIGVLLSWHFWEELRGEQDSLSETVRNLGLVIGGAIAILLAVWRSTVSERQANTAQQSLLNERYERGAEMLGSSILPVRLGGIFALQQLANEEPSRYHIRIMRLFCAFVVQASKDSDGVTGQTMAEDVANHEVIWAGPDSSTPLPMDVQAAMDAIRVRSKKAIMLERHAFYRLGLTSANLKGIRLMGANLSHAVLTDADLSGAFLSHANLFHAWLDGAKLPRTDLRFANLSGTVLVRPRPQNGQPEEVDRRPATGLTQEMLDETCADAEDPPQIEGVLDAETGKPLVWRGQPCHKNQELEG